MEFRVEEIADAIRRAHPSKPVITIETHISLVFLSTEFVYKVKKPLRNAFLDYTTLEARKHFCLEELRLDSRYAPGLYIEVVPITFDNNLPTLQGNGPVCEYAIKMHRFPDDALLSYRLRSANVSSIDINLLSDRVAQFHDSASKSDQKLPFGEPSEIFQQAVDNLDALESIGKITETEATLIRSLRVWTHSQFKALESVFADRKQNGFVRECHGDLHCGNVVFWQGCFVPFDGIEFNDAFRWIDVLNDIAFLIMDLEARQSPGLANLATNCYLEHTGDYSSLNVLRWYIVYRALVRAKVASLEMQQHSEESPEFTHALQKKAKLIELANSKTAKTKPRLWITHGLSGSGKSTGAELFVRDHGAIRLRADVERKRLLGINATQRPTMEQSQTLYSPATTVRTYERLQELARTILLSGHSVIVDATFLKQQQRQGFIQLGHSLGLKTQIVSFEATPEVLRQRIRDRMRFENDPSDANMEVLEHQLATHEPLNEIEKELEVKNGTDRQV